MNVRSFRRRQALGRWAGKDEMEAWIVSGQLGVSVVERRDAFVCVQTPRLFE